MRYVGIASVQSQIVVLDVSRDSFCRTSANRDRIVPHYPGFVGHIYAYIEALQDSNQEFFNVIEHRN